MANEGIEIEVYSYQDPTVKVGSIFGRTKPQSLEELDGDGGGSFVIADSDPHVKLKPELLDARNVCTVSINNVLTHAYLIRDIKDVPLSSSGESYREVSGPGLMEWFDDAEVYPYDTLRSYSPATRYFNFASEVGPWYSNYSWADPVEYGKVKDKNLIWKQAPDKWPAGAENARWVWTEPYSSDAPTDPCYFRYTITIAESGTYAIYSAVDNAYELYVDGEFIAKSNEKSSSYLEATRIEVTLGAGTHVIGYKAWNFSPTSDVAINPAALLMAIFKVGANQETMVGRSGASGWKCLSYPAAAPGWTIGEVLISLVNEAKARGVRSMNWMGLNFTSTKDSKGNDWEDRVEWSWDVGTSYYDIITDLQDAFDIWINPSNHQVNIAPERGTNRAVPIGSTPPVQFMMGKHLISAEMQVRAKIKNNLLIQTDEGWIQRTASAASIEKYGRIEGSLQVSGTAAAGAVVAKAVFNQRAQAEEGASYELVVGDLIPKTDFNVGDWVLAPDRSGNPVARRVMSLSVTEDESGNPVWTIEFDTIFRDNEDKINRIISKLGGGGASTSSGSAKAVSSDGRGPVVFPPSTPPVDYNDEIPPPAPSTPISSSRMGVVGITWDGKDENGLDMPFDFSYVEVMQGAVPGTSVGILQVGSGNNTAHITDLPYDDPTEFWLRAVDFAGNISDKSESVFVTTTGVVDTDVSDEILDAITEITQAAVVESIGGGIVWATTIPTTADGTGRPVGVTWYRRDSSNNIIGMWEWDGTAWQSRNIDGSSLAGGTVTAAKIEASVMLAITNSQAAAVAALTAAAEANTAATAAQTTADGKNKIVRSTAVASSPTSYVAGDQWWQYSGTQIIAMWLHSGSAWVSQTLTDSIITNLNAGTITAGTLNADRIAAASITAAKMVAGTITAASGIIGDAAIVNAKIANGAITSAKIGDAEIISAKIADGAIVTAKIGDAQITNAKIVTIDAGKISTGFLDAARIQANTITVSKLAVTNMNNLAENSSFEYTGAWIVNAAADYFATSLARTGSQCLRLVTTGALITTVATRDPIQVEEGETYSFSFWARTASGTSPAGSLRASIRYGVTGVESGVNSSGGSQPTLTTTWQLVSCTVVIPAGMKFFRPEVRQEATATGTIYIDDAMLVRRADSSLIVDGAITALKLAANAVEADAIASNAVTAAKIAAGAITAVKISADAIDGMTITGSTIRTAASGARTVLNSTGLTAYNSSNQAMVQVGQGISTGMAVRDSASGLMVPLGAHVFGTTTGYSSGWTLLKPSTTSTMDSPVYSAWQYSAFTSNPFQTPTGRAVIFAWMNIDSLSVRQNYNVDVQIQVVLASNTSTILAAGPTVHVDWSQSSLNFVATGLPAGTDMYIQYRARTMMFSNVGTPTAGERGWLAMPI